MYDDNQNDDRDEPTERSFDPARLAIEKSDEFRMFAELAAVFEGVRKFDASLRPGLDIEAARTVQRGVATLEKLRVGSTPIIEPQHASLAATVLAMPLDHPLATSDYHIHRRPGETMIVRWLAGDEVDTFYERLQAHFDAALNSFCEEKRSSEAWKQNEATTKLLDALDGMNVQMAGQFFRQPIREHNLFALSTQAADEMNIAYLTDFIMGVSPAAVVGATSAPPEEPSDADLAWFFKLFLLRGSVDGVERMCFFTYLQKSDDSFDL